MHYAAGYKPLNVIKQMRSAQSTADVLDSGEDFSESILSCLLQTCNADVNCQDYYGATPLHYAAIKGNPKSVEEIIEYGRVNVNVSSCILLLLLINKEQRRRVSPKGNSCGF